MDIKVEKVTIKETVPFLSYDAPRWLRVIEHFIRIKIFGQNRYLIDWTIDADELVAYHGIDVGEEFARILMEEIEVELKLEMGDEYKTPEERNKEQLECLTKIYEDYIKDKS